MSNGNYNVKKTRPFLTFLVVLLVLALIATIVAFFWKLTNGFKDFSWFTDEVDSEVDEELDDYSYNEIVYYMFESEDVSSLQSVCVMEGDCYGE